MNGYMKIRVTANGQQAECWQRIEEGAVTGHVNDAGDPVRLPEIHEAECVDGQLYFAPGVLVDPEAPVTANLFEDS